MTLVLENLSTTIDSWTKVGDPRVAIDAMVSGINPGLYSVGRYSVPAGKKLVLSSVHVALGPSQLENSANVNPSRQGVAEVRINGVEVTEISLQKTNIDLQGSIEGAFGGASFHQNYNRRTIDFDGITLAAGETAEIIFSPVALAGTSIQPMRITASIFSEDVTGGAARIEQGALIPFDSTANQPVVTLTAPSGGSILRSVAVDLLSTYKNLYAQVKIRGTNVFEGALVRSEQKSAPFNFSIPAQGLVLYPGEQIELLVGAAFPANQHVGLQISGELVNAVGVQGAAWVS